MKTFQHEAVYYQGPESFVARLEPFIREGVAAREPVMVMAPPDRLAALRLALGADATRVRFVDMSVVGRNPARIIPEWRAFADEHAGRPARGVGEPIWTGRSADELEECHVHEALLNLAFGDAAGFLLTCPYDARSLDPAVIAESRRTHPLGDGEQFREYPGPPSAAQVFARPLPPSPPDARTLAFSDGDVRAVRAVAGQAARAFGLDEIAAGNFALAAHELAINSVRHGGGHGTLRLWESAAALTGEIADAGRIDAPLIGRVRPHTDQEDGRGVWIANQLCDLVQIRSGEAGTSVRFHTARRYGVL